MYEHEMLRVCQQNDLKLLKKIVSQGKDVNEYAFGWYPLTYAVYYGRVEIVDYMLSHGADINHQDRNRTPFIVSCDSGVYIMIKFLILKGADIQYSRFFLSSYMKTYEYQKIICDRKPNGIHELIKNNVILHKWIQIGRAHV